MKNTLSITSDCVCTCVDSIADGSNRIFVALNVGNVSAPVLKIWLGDTLKNTIDLAANELNGIEIPTALFVANGVIKFQYLDADYAGEIFNINFPDRLDGNLSVKMQSDYVYTAKYTVIGGGGSVEPYILPPAKADTLGGIMVGDNLVIDESGRLSATAAPDPYTLPPATTGRLGGVIVGDNLSVEENGRVSAPAPYELPIAKPSILGGVKIGSNLAFRADGTLDAVTNAFCRYSTSEQVVGTWIDGKPIYQQTFTGASKTINNIEQLVSIMSMGTRDGGDVDPIPMPYSNGARWSLNTSGVLNFSNGTDLNYTSIVTTVQYTKTTDKAVSYIINPDADSYSLDERVVGTWIDGKPVYQKTFVVENTVVLTTDWKSIIQISENVEKLVASGIYDPYYVNNMCLIKYANGYLQGLAPIGTLGINAGSYITLQYTKTTD